MSDALRLPDDDDSARGVRSDIELVKTASGDIAPVLSVSTSDGGGDAAIRVGDLLGGKYELLDVLNEGGMGTLFVARNVDLDVPVAVKVIRPSEHDREGSYLAERLMREARAAAGLGHPAIVKVFDVGRTERGEPFVVMELLEGEDLRAAMERHGRVEPTKAVRCILPIVHALAVAHAHEVIHRDVKPANIFLADTPTGQYQPKLIDFGLAKLTPKAGDRLTWAGATLGTPDYMAPEQALGDEVDAAVDIWAVCVVIYEMVTGTTPFVGKNHIALLNAIIDAEPPPLSEHGVDADRLWTILSKGLAKDPKARWPSIRDLGAALARWLVNMGCRDDVCGAPLTKLWLVKERGAARDVFRTGEFRAQGEGHDAPASAAPVPTSQPTARSVRRPGGSMTPVVVAFETDASESDIRAAEAFGAPPSSERVDAAELGEMPTMPAASLRALDPAGELVEAARQRARRAVRPESPSDPGARQRERSSSAGLDDRARPSKSHSGHSGVSPVAFLPARSPSLRGIALLAAGAAIVAAGMLGTWMMLHPAPRESSPGAGVSSAVDVAAPRPVSSGAPPGGGPAAPSAPTHDPSAAPSMSSSSPPREVATATSQATAGAPLPSGSSRPTSSAPVATRNPQPPSTGARPAISDYLPPSL